MMKQITWHQERVDPFDDADFYEPGPIVTVTVDGRSITVDREGRSDLVHTALDETVTHFRTTAEFRFAFSDGNTPVDDSFWAWENNGWFDLYDGDGNHMEDDDHVAHSLAEALADAEGCLTGELSL